MGRDCGSLALRGAVGWFCLVMCDGGWFSRCWSGEGSVGGCLCRAEPHRALTGFSGNFLSIFKSSGLFFCGLPRVKQHAHGVIQLRIAISVLFHDIIYLPLFSALTCSFFSLAHRRGRLEP